MARNRRNNKQPRLGKRPSTTKHVPKDAIPHIPDDQLSWRFEYMDMGGDWSCAEVDAVTLQAIRNDLLHFEARTWNQTRGSGTKGTQHPLPASGICRKAKKRLQEIGRDDWDTLWEFRLSGKWRVWGWQSGSVCYLLWWDPDHTVWPVEKKHT